jgi:hypothetical protein
VGEPFSVRSEVAEMGNRGVTRTSVITMIALALLAAAIVYSSVGLGAHRCEVCIEFGGRQVCRTVEAATEEEARLGATTNACGVLASGVTNTLRCQRTPPTRMACESAR